MEVMTRIEVTPTDFEYIRKLLRERSAIALESGKEYLVESRLRPVVRDAGFASISELVESLRNKRMDGLHQRVVEAMTTHETSFFRDIYPFEALKNVVLPDLATKRAQERSLNIWCAAASSGQEPYTIAMVLREYLLKIPDWPINIVASDISSQILEKARSGSYCQIEVNRGLPATCLTRYFQRNGLLWQIRDELRKMCDFRQINLIEPWPPMPKMDIIFMRNVLIYFDTETKKDILRRIRLLIRPDGYLFLGGAETTINLDDEFERMPMDKTGCYRLRGL